MAAAGVRRSRANPFKSTQLRQWGFICYLGGHIVSRRERTDRLRRASDGAGPREPAPTEDAAPRERLYLPRIPFPFSSTPSPPRSLSLSLSRPFYFTAATLLSSSTSLPSARKADSPLHVRVEISLGLPTPFHPFRVPRWPSSRFLSLLEIFDGKIWPFVCAFVSLASQAAAAGTGTGEGGGLEVDGN